MINLMLAYVTALRADERGATAVEYGVMVALIAAAIVLTVTALGGGLNGLFNGVTTTIGGTPAP